MPPQPRRKKWTEAEERTLIHKYGEMSRDGILSKMKTREKKYKPIALHVNAAHHARDPSSYPWQWTWKDVSTKIQNMRHQYSLVKQKIKKLGEGEEDEFDWPDGTTHWANFLHYKDVFGDVPLVNCSPGGVNEILPPFVGTDFVGGVMDLEFDYDPAEDYNNENKEKKESFIEDPNGSGHRRKGKVGWGFISGQLGRLREMEARLERREVERECERQRRENVRAEMEREREREREEIEMRRRTREEEREEARRQWARKLEAVERESEERDRMRREERLVREREWEERMERRREEWKKRMDEMLGRHRAEMGQMQARLLHEQQSLAGQFIGLMSQWAGHPAGLTDHHTGAGGHYLSQMMQGLHHVNGMVHGDARVEGDNQEDQFIVDG